MSDSPKKPNGETGANAGDDKRLRPDIVLTRADKNPLVVKSQVMPAAGTFGYGDAYKGLIDVSNLAAIVTAPVSLEPRAPASGTRVIPLDGGLLMHTGLPNPGLSQVIKQHSSMWSLLPVPVILHLIGTKTDHVRRSMAQLEGVDSIAAVELGLEDEIQWRDAERLIKAAVDHYEQPVLVRIPLQDTFDIAEAAADAGAGALVISGPPRGTARDSKSGRLTSGRIYGPLVKPLVLRMVGQVVGRLPTVPVIGAGGIHSLHDARDYLDAGAVAVQVDSVVWMNPRQLEYIARDMTGLTVTRETGALYDEWYEGMSASTLKNLRGSRKQGGAKS